MRETEKALQAILAKDYAAEYEEAGDKLEWLGARQAFEVAVVAVQEEIAAVLVTLHQEEVAAILGRGC